jgi:Icc-related predicted phosphoesterase
VIIASDLHFEFHRDRGVSLARSLGDADVLVCAGDLSNTNGVEDGLRLLCARYPAVVFVAGNHEFYGGTIKETRERLARLESRVPNLHYLDNTTCEIDDIRFVGTTLWFRAIPGISKLHHAMNDFSWISAADPEIYDENRRALDFLSAEVREDDVVVTHHLPSNTSVHPRYSGSSLNVFFLCDVQDIIEARKPALWVHGHTHESVDARVGTTRIICNPFGYAGLEINPRFREDLVIDI